MDCLKTEDGGVITLQGFKMDLRPIPFAIGTQTGFSIKSNRSDLINLYPHLEDPGSKTEMILLNTEGIRQISTDLPGKILGLYEFDGIIYIATRFEILSWDGEVFASISKAVSFPHKRVFIADNGISVVFVGYNGYAYTPKTPDPTPIKYTVKDDAGNESNISTVSLVYPPVQVDPITLNNSKAQVQGSPITIDVLSNAVDGTGTIVPDTLNFTDSDATDSEGTGYDDTLIVDDEGTWTMDRPNGSVIFTPEGSFTESPSPVRYNVEDDNGVVSNRSTIHAVYADGGDAPTTANVHTAGDRGSPETVIDILSNDIAGTGGDIDPTTVHIEGSTDGEYDVNGEGVWAVDDTTGAITFTPKLEEFKNMGDEEGWYPSDTVAYMDGYFIFNRTGTGQFFISQLYSTDIDPLDWATGEAAPDDTRAVVVAGRQLWIMGTRTVEVWYDNGDPLFPFTRISGAVNDLGLASANTIGRIYNTVLFVGSDYRVYMTNGYTPTPISTAAIELLVDTHDVKKYMAFTYFNNGHYFYVLHLNEKITVVYDMMTGLWHKRKSCKDEEDPIIGGGKWKIDGAINKYDDTKIYGYSDKKFYEVSTDLYTEDGIKIRREAVSQPLNPTPNHVTLAEVQVDMEAGGYEDTPISNSQVWIQFSSDDGKTWGNRRISTIGKKGDYKNRARWQRIGQHRDLIAKVVITDPIPIRLLGLWVRS